MVQRWKSKMIVKEIVFTGVWLFLLFLQLLILVSFSHPLFNRSLPMHPLFPVPLFLLLFVSSSHTPSLPNPTSFSSSPSSSSCPLCFFYSFCLFSSFSFSSSFSPSLSFSSSFVPQRLWNKALFPFGLNEVGRDTIRKNANLANPGLSLLQQT